LIALNLASYAQNNCDCDQKPELKTIISCKPSVFKNGAMLFREFDCNSSKLIFKNGRIEKTIFRLNKDLLELTNRLGYTSWMEFKNAFLIENRLISGCCDPSEYILFNKSNGEIISKLGTSLYQTEKQNDKPFILTLENYNTLLITNLSTNKSYQIHLPKGLLEKSLETSKYLFVEYLFEEGRLIKNDFYIKYNHRENIKDNWKATVLKFKLSAYGI
jgi:hypothetical protein